MEMKFDGKGKLVAVSRTFYLSPTTVRTIGWHHVIEIS